MDVLRGTREYTQKQKTKVRKSGRSILRKVEQLGVGGEVLTVVVFRDPLSGDFCVGGHVPEGETAPDLNLLVRLINSNFIFVPTDGITVQSPHERTSRVSSTTKAPEPKCTKKALEPKGNATDNKFIKRQTNHYRREQVTRIY